MAAINADTRAIEDISTGLRETFRRTALGLDLAVETAERAVDDCRRHVAQRRAVLNAAVEALHACLARKDANCSLQSTAVSKANERLGNAQKALLVAERAREQVAADSRRFSDQGGEIVRSGEATLRDKLAALGLLGALSGTAVASASAGSGLGRSRASAPTTNLKLIRAPGLPKGMYLVPMDMIDHSINAVTSQSDFRKGYTPADLEWAFDAFDQVVLPGLGAGMSLNDFRDRDQASGRQGTRSFGDTCSGFLGMDAICLSRTPNGLLRIENGQHRIWLAQQLGRSHIPARVI